jgi:hypothetical protein
MDRTECANERRTDHRAIVTRRVLLEMPATKDANTATDRTASVAISGEKTIVITASAIPVASKSALARAKNTAQMDDVKDTKPISTTGTVPAAVLPRANVKHTIAQLTTPFTNKESIAYPSCVGARAPEGRARRAPRTRFNGPKRKTVP